MTRRLFGLLCAIGVAWPGWGQAAAAVAAFASYGNRAGELIEPHGLAVQGESGVLYVVDSYNHRAEQYTADGTFIRAWGWGVTGHHNTTLQRCVRVCFPGDSGAGNGELGFTEGIAVNNDAASPSYGDVYVVDISNHRVEKFTASGRFLLMFGSSVNDSARARHDPSEENICPVRRGDQCGAGSIGRAAGKFEFPVEGNFIGIGPHSEVYVGDRDRVERFGADGRFLSQLRLLPKPEGSGGEEGGISGLAIDASGDTYVIRQGVSGVREYDPNGTPLRTLYAYGEAAGPEGPTPAIELGPQESLFVDVNDHGTHEIIEYDALGSEVARFDAGMPDGLHGLAYNQNTNTLYILETNSTITPAIARIRTLTPPTVGPLSGLPAPAWLTSLEG